MYTEGDTVAMYRKFGSIENQGDSWIISTSDLIALSP